MDDVAWGALTLTLTALAGTYTWWAFRNRGVSAGVRGVGFTLLPLALLLTNSLRMVTRIGTAIADWATDLAWNPLVWAGLLLGGISVVCFVVAGFLTRRELGTPEPSKQRGGGSKELPAGRRSGSQPVLADEPVDNEMAEIEALLRKRGIT
jgi:heme exporter protein D